MFSVIKRERNGLQESGSQILRIEKYYLYSYFFDCSLRGRRLSKNTILYRTRQAFITSNVARKIPIRRPIIFLWFQNESLTEICFASTVSIAQSPSRLWYGKSHGNRTNANNASSEEDRNLLCSMVLPRSTKIFESNFKRQII